MADLKPNEIDASPTKDFFIRAITQDIHLIDVVPDLVGNCLDGARRIGKEKDLKGLKIFIEIDSDHFKIKDNCGGIKLDNARNYAFRFGRDEQDPRYVVKGSIGEFGIGMKRAIFRMGNNAVVESKTDEEHFIIPINVENWKRKTDEWVFEFKTINDQDSPNNLQEPGTVIEVTNLHSDVAGEFGDLFTSGLREKILNKFSDSLERGLEIILNDIPIGYEGRINLLHSDDIVPVKYEMQLGEEDKKVHATVFLGITERDTHAAGFYIFCNGQLVLEADKTETTGWGEELGRQYNNELAYFRGYVFMTSDHTHLLPWDTTKTRINTDSAIYKSDKLEMIKRAKPILEFLGKLAKEKRKDEQGNKPEDTPLNDMVDMASKAPMPLSKLPKTVSTFVEPKVKKVMLKPKQTHVQYFVPKEKYEKVKEKIKAKNITQVGQKTFDYYYDNEIEGEM